MRLKHIKLAGFKSFVEPTKVPFEQQMTAIVGPNGCGKSNIIDAVRWVLGESSAKHLRGDAMTDVIFNGAATRKPVGQASVELLFDNVAGKIQGSMADRNQVAIRRVVNRDGQNSYYLNGTKCRKKDITDIFLGTGLGSRSYAIIEQGTISRLIESKPQELRVFIEEAAGISKYKERRRDTENRIRHTRENLARLTDIRLELEHQLDKLHQQAEAAKRFKTLKAQERTTKAELAALRWQKHHQQLQTKQQQIVDIEQQLAKQVATQQSDDHCLTNAKKAVVKLSDDIGQLQQQKIQLTNDIARLEQQLTYIKQQQLKLQSDKTQYQQQIHQAQQSLLAEQQQLIALKLTQNEQQQAFKTLEQTLTDIEQQLESDSNTLSKEQQRGYQLQQQKDTLAAKFQHYNSRCEKLKSEQQFIQSRAVTVSEQYHQLIEKQQTMQNADELANGEQLTIVNEQIATIEQTLIALLAQISVSQKQLLALNQQQSERQGTHNALTHQIARLEINLSEKTDWQLAQQQWLEELKQPASNSLQEKLSIQPGWELATEMVLSEQLVAQCVTGFSLANLQANQLPETLLLLQQASNVEQVKSATLAEKVTGAPEIITLLNKVNIAENITQALSLVAELAADESVICPQGLWLSASFIRYGVVSQKNHHLHDRQELNSLIKQLAELDVELTDGVKQHKVIEQLLQSQQSQQQELNYQLKQKQQQQQEHQQAHQLQAQALEMLNDQIQLAANEKQALAKKLAQLTEELAQLEQEAGNAEQLQGEVSTLEQNAQQLQHFVQQLQQKVQTQQQQHKECLQQKHRAELQLEKTAHHLVQLEQSIVRLQESVIQLTKQQATNSELLQQNIAPLAQEQQQLVLWQAQMLELDQQLTHRQQSLQKEQQAIEQIEQKQRAEVETIAHLKDKLSQLQLESESCRVKAQAALEQLQEFGHTLELVLNNMPVQAKESLWQAQLVKLSKDIQSLGAINLAAIDEFDSQLTRKNYLDQQDQDLNLAITTLESAIAKIDKESRQKFKTTFDKVNQDLQLLFPKVFGGGSAYLNLTDEDLLETGITIMARPPGKKNSTIHLLSGGEKALTALSLVFAIFRLNPAPFCMLDEVDAPLDDANVVRFCNLVEEMSQSVQFIYISHNKIAMEMASHLAGVTMFEAGVSRMVSVDIDEAIAMAEVS